VRVYILERSAYSVAKQRHTSHYRFNYFAISLSRGAKTWQYLPHFNGKKEAVFMDRFPLHKPCIECVLSRA
jgi:hypothetical protein